MITIRDSKGRVACMADEKTGVVETKYNKVVVRTTLNPGCTFTISRDGTQTRVTLNSNHKFEIDPLPPAA